MDVLTDSVLTGVIEPLLSPGDPVDETVNFIRGAVEPHAQRYDTTTTIEELLSMLQESPDTVRADVLRIYHTTEGTVAHKLAAARKYVITGLVQALVSLATEKRQQDRDNRVCTLHPNCTFYAGHSIAAANLTASLITILLHDLDLSKEDNQAAIAVVQARLAPVAALFHHSATMEELSTAIARAYRDPILRIAARTQAQYAWTHATGNAAAKMVPARREALEQLVNTAVLQVRMPFLHS
jgi:hypothetical protein